MSLYFLLYINFGKWDVGEIIQVKWGSNTGFRQCQLTDYDQRWKWLGTSLILINALKNNSFRPRRNFLIKERVILPRVVLQQWRSELWKLGVKEIDMDQITTKIFQVTFQALFHCSVEGLMLKTSSASQFSLGHCGNFTLINLFN